MYKHKKRKKKNARAKKKRNYASKGGIANYPLSMNLSVIHDPINHMNSSQKVYTVHTLATRYCIQILDEAEKQLKQIVLFVLNFFEG